VWDAASGKLAFRLAGHTARVDSMSWHPEGRRLASAAHETIKLWDTIGRQEIVTLDAGDAVARLRWSHDGQRLAAAAGKNIKIWDASVGYSMYGSNRATAPLSGPGGPVAGSSRKAVNSKGEAASEVGSRQ